MPYAMNGAIRIHYELEGDGPPLVLHTGFASALEDWYTLGYVDGLKHDYRLILVDPRGQGQSDAPHSSEAYTPEHRVGDVVAVLDALAVDRAHFWGYSMGGRLAFDLTVQRSDRVASVIAGGAHPWGSPPNVAWAELLRHGIKAWLASVQAAPGFSPLPQIMQERFLSNDSEALAAATLVERPNLEPQVGTIDVPVLIYCGEQDLAYDGARRAATSVSNATFVSLPGLDHIAAFVCSDEILPSVGDFLARSSARSTAAPA